MMWAFTPPRPIRSIAALVPIGTVLISTLLYGDVRTARADVAVGASAADFLQFEIGARSAGMAGAQTSSATGVSAQFWNPALVGGITSPQVGVMHATWLEDLSFDWIGVARPISPRLGVASFGVSYFHMPSIAGNDEFGNPTGTFRVYDVAVSVGLARPVTRNMSLGLNAKLIRQNLATVSATGFAADLGAAATLAGTSFGASVQNLGPSLGFSGSSYPLPRTIRLGTSRPFLDGRLLLAADYTMPRDYYNDVRFGTEIRAVEQVSLRLGYRHQLGVADDPNTGLSYGLGLYVRQFAIDYAMTPNDAFSNIHRLSFGYSFGGPDRERPEQPKRPKPVQPPPPAGPSVIASGNAPKNSASAAAPAASKLPSPATQEKRVEIEYAVVLPGYGAKEVAQAELKALELLGFRTKDAQIVQVRGGGYSVRLARMKSKSRAEEMAASLARMSFRVVVETVQK